MEQAGHNAARLYFRSSDLDIFRLLAEYHFLQPSHFHELTGRNVISLRARLRQLYQRGYLNRTTSVGDRAVPCFDPPSFVYYLGRKGALFAAKHGYLDTAKWRGEKSRVTLDHDLEITNLHIRLRQAFGERLTFWEQGRSELKDYVSINRVAPQLSS